MGVKYGSHIADVKSCRYLIAFGENAISSAVEAVGGEVVEAMLA